MKSSPSVPLLLLAFLFLGMFLRVGAALKFPTVDSPDEILETHEPAHHLAYGYSGVAWEWSQGARSWVFPAFLAGVMRTTDWMGSGSAGYQWGIALVLSLISLTTVWFGFAWARRASGMEAAINVPIVLLEQTSELEQEPRSFNAVLTRGSLSEPKDGFELAACWNGYCLYRGPGPCAPPQGGNEINDYLRMHGN